MPFEQRTMKISPATYDRVTTVKLAMEREKKRSVSYSETVDYLADHWETLDQIAADARKVG
jgi:hypothetical protein